MKAREQSLLKVNLLAYIILIYLIKCMKEDLQRVISIIASKELSRDEKVNQTRVILEKNPDIVHIKISNEALYQLGVVGPYIDKITLLHLVTYLDCVEIAQLLIEKGANVNAVSGDKFQSTPLHEAAFHGSKKIAELLLECNAKIESRDNFGDTPLHYASHSGSKEVVKLLLEKGANVNAVTTTCGETPLHQASTNCHIDSYLKIVKMLLDYAANTEIEDLHNCTPLFVAVSYGEVEAIKLLLNAQANVNSRNKKGETPLHVVVNGRLISTSKERCEAAELLLKYGADVDAKDNDGNTPLHHAALERSKGVAKLLLEHGANINETNNYGITPLEMSTYEELFSSVNKQVDPEPVVKFLIKQTLKKNPSTKKPDFMKKMENSSYWKEAEYSDYWDKCQLENTKFMLLK